MKKKLITKLVCGLLATTMVLGVTGCGGSKDAGSASVDGSEDNSATAGENGGVASDSPYAGKGLDLSNHETVVMYVLGDAPEDLDDVISKANSEYFEPNLNTTLDLEFLNWSDYSTKYSLLLAGGDPVDLIYTASWCYYNEEVENGAFKVL